ncbi:hypothetical protein MY10362_005742 [Beauveria mimosiformis]
MTSSSSPSMRLQKLDSPPASGKYGITAAKKPGPPLSTAVYKSTSNEKSQKKVQQRRHGENAHYIATRAW